MKLSASASLLAMSLAAVSCNAAQGGNEGAANESAGGADNGAIYATYGVHNPPAATKGGCANPDCRYVRGPGEPADPLYPPFWQSRWTMYRVYAGYRDTSAALCRPAAGRDPI